MKTCPNCGGELREGASFCPHCARSVAPQEEWKPPRIVRRQVVYLLLAVLVCAAMLLGGWIYFRPKTYEGGAEVTYRDRDGVTYQILASWADTRHEPAEVMVQTVDSDAEQIRFPTCIFVNRLDVSATDAPSFGETNAAFMEKVDHVTAEALDQEGKAGPVSLTQPESRLDYIPEALLVSFVDFSGKSDDCGMLFTIYMKNGDIIRLRQQLALEKRLAGHIYPEDAPMETSRDLQALVDAASLTASDYAEICVHLPPKTYTGEVYVTLCAINFYGSEDDQGNRTTFTAPVQVTPPDSSIYTFKGIDFTGGGSGTGLTVTQRCHLRDCTVSGWETGVLLWGRSSWLNFNDCVFEDNQVGAAFEAFGISVSHTLFYGNVFRNNGTGLLLNYVPTDLTMYFGDTVFEGNGIDIDNRCGQSVDLGFAEE